MSDPLTQLRLLVEAQERATKGPWHRFNYIGSEGGLRRVQATVLSDRVLECKEPPKRFVAECEDPNDAALLVLARNTDLAAILERLEQP